MPPRSDQPHGLTPKQLRFVEEYMIDRSATAAAKRAGYSAKTAHSAGPRLLTNVGVKAEVARRTAAQGERAAVTVELVIEGLREIAHRCMAKKRFNAVGATRAYELLGKHIGMFTERLDIGVKGEIVIVEEIVE